MIVWIINLQKTKKFLNMFPWDMIIINCKNDQLIKRIIYVWWWREIQNCHWKWFVGKKRSCNWRIMPISKMKSKRTTKKRLFLLTKLIRKRDDNWRIDLIDLEVYSLKNKKSFWYTSKVIDSFPNFGRTGPVKKKFLQQKTHFKMLLIFQRDRQ